MDESIFCKEPIYSIWLDSGAEMEFDIPLNKCLLDPRKTYALRLSVFEV